ncbi:unnamed protein product [Trichobilharzia szidati]|nr:unnamed protein product [Trichobilharzia szidati]
MLTDHSSNVCALDGAALFENACCDSRLLKNAESAGVLEFTELWNAFWHNVGKSFRADAKYLRKYIVRSLRLTKTGLHDLFASTYGYNYNQNKDFVENFFRELENYMLGDRQDIASLVDNFFESLLYRVLRVMLLVKTEQDLSAANCIASKLKPLKPFEQAPEVIRAMSVRAFPPARILRNGLRFANSILQSLSTKFTMNHSCTNEWIKLRYCNLCSAIIQPVICRHDCFNRLSACLLPWTSFDKYWILFIDQLILIAERLKDSRSFPQVIRPLQIHISDGIMNLQTVLFRLEQSEEWFHDCLGEKLKNSSSSLFRHKSEQPGQLQRKQRFVIPSNDQDISLQRHKQSYIYSNHNELKLWADNIRKKYYRIRKPFSNMVNYFCSDEFLRNSVKSRNGVCWTGEKLIPRSHPPSKSFVNEGNIHIDPVIIRAIKNLQQMTKIIQLVVENNSDPNYMSIGGIDSTTDNNKDSEIVRDHWFDHLTTTPSSTNLLNPSLPHEYENISTNNDHRYLSYTQSSRASQDLNSEYEEYSGISPAYHMTLNPSTPQQSRAPGLSDDEDFATFHQAPFMTNSNQFNKQQLFVNNQRSIFTSSSSSSSTNDIKMFVNTSKLSPQVEEDKQQKRPADTMPYINPPHTIWLPSIFNNISLFTYHREIVWTLHTTKTTTNSSSVSNTDNIPMLNTFLIAYIYLLYIYFR